MIKKLILIFALILVCASAVSAADLNGTGDFDDLAGQITLTGENQTLNLEKDYVLADTDEKHIVIDRPMTIDGNNHSIESVDTERVFWVQADNVVIKNINFINSSPGELAGGVISWWGNGGTLEDCSFTNNTASSAGGAVLWKGDKGLIDGCSFRGNTVKYGVATTLVDGDGYDKSMMIIQVVNSEGGALYISGNDIAVNDCSFTDNVALLDGGAISTGWGRNITISNSRFRGNSAGYNGGAVDLNGEDCRIVNSTLTGNTPNDLFNNCPNTEILDSVIGQADGMYNLSYLAGFDDLSSIINSADEGSVIVLDKDYEYVNGSIKGILINKTITIDGAGHRLIGNHLSRMFYITADNVVIRNLNFINGNALGRYFSNQAGGGAIYWNGDNGFIENCSFTNNTGSGIEDDPFEKEETFTDENGTVWHSVRMRPMGAKINEGGAIVWNGTNGTVSKCIFTNNNVGYPNSGGAVCWRGANGTIIGSEFYGNGAWCGAAVCWIGDNGSILESEISKSGFLDGGLFWFGHNGTIRHCILLSHSRAALGNSGGDFTADYNFWGDTIVNPNEYNKAENVTNWIVMKISHNGEFVVKGEEILIEYDIANLFENGNLSKYESISDKYCGEILYTAPRTGFLNVTFTEDGLNITVDSRDHIQSKNAVVYYDKEISYSVAVTDVWGPVINRTVSFKVAGQNYEASTDEKGVATLKVNLQPGKYKVYTSYGNLKVKNKLTVKTTLVTKDISKKAGKSARFKVKVLNRKGKVYPKQKVKVKFNGKTYKLKTNRKGIAALKVSKNLKAGIYIVKTSYNGLTNSNKITVKK